MSQSRFELIDGVDYYTIENAERLPEFLVSAISSGEHWMFISSMGALTAGRRDTEGSLFPYETVDKIMAGKVHTGPRTRIRLENKGRKQVWEPFADWTRAAWEVERSVSKAKTGHIIRFKERNVSLGLFFGYSWGFSHRFGFIRKVFIGNEGNTTVNISITDGLYNLMSGGVTKRLQDRLSCLADAYKDSVLDMDTGVAAYSLASAVTDRAEPREALTATVAWSAGLEPRTVSISKEELAPDGSLAVSVPASRSLGRKGDYILCADFELGPGATKTWYVVADTGRDHAAVENLRAELRGGTEAMPSQLNEEQRLIGMELEAIIGAVDGLSASQIAMHEWHHTANALFNAMRGGYPLGGMRLDPADLVAFIAARNNSAGTLARTLLDRAGIAGGADGRISRSEAVNLLCSAGSLDLARLAREYVPISFSRRHGDPSRPWNEFSIRVREASGVPVLDYQGNWRDIFQNWEALGRSYPGYLESFISLFLNATTVDGYNPYRISRTGVDWEREDSEDPWSNIGYWNDHQLIYLSKLIESYDSHFPGTLGSGLCERRYAWADVPYHIVPYDEICRDPRSTVRFDRDGDRLAGERFAHIGGDGRLVPGPDGEVMHGSLLDKITSIFAAKIGNFVPGGGVWMNTQRPEWNDANNALAGYGLSMVTVMYMHRFAAFWLDTIRGSGLSGLELAEPLEVLLHEQLSVMDSFGSGASSDPGMRRRFMDAMGRSLERYRSCVYSDKTALDIRVAVERAMIERWLKRSIELVDTTIRAGKRPDGLYDAYSLLSLGNGEARVKRLYPMLEGQVAALSSGLLGVEESVALMTSLRSGPLYCADRKTWLLYPDRELPDFFSKNRCPESTLATSPLARMLVERGQRDILYRDAGGAIRFAPALVNEAELAMALDRLGSKPEWAAHVERGRQEIEELYEVTFGHAGFTGRSGAMYAYEGLGSVYWHMVAKLLLALAELREKTVLSDGEKASTGHIDELDRTYLMAREGIGYQRSPEEWGAFPFDPYSHTPKGGGARQPGMTGQVKEEILTRLAEFGIAVREGTIRLVPTGLLAGEFLSAPKEFVYYDAQARRVSINLKAGELAICLAGVPFIRAGSEGPMCISADLADGIKQLFNDQLDTELSASIFRREGKVLAVRVSGGASRV